jgi:hypothetical protein
MICAFERESKKICMPKKEGRSFFHHAVTVVAIGNFIFKPVCMIVTYLTGKRIFIFYFIYP